ncbi:hypothetical protein ENBRE01_0276 [Enteropsectra breve]|nr:hypothetical protein ENBRE01_0276 [Enteropsectra breve]
MFEYGNSLQSLEQFTNMTIQMFSMQINKSPFLMRPDVVCWVRIMFAVACLVEIALSMFIFYRIKKINDKRIIKLPRTGYFNSSDAAEREVTVCEYETSQCSPLLSSIVLIFYPIAIAFMHYKWNVNYMFVGKIITLFKNLAFNSLYHAYLFNIPSVRPYNKFKLYEPKRPEVEEIKDNDSVQKIDKKRKKED